MKKLGGRFKSLIPKMGGRMRKGGRRKKAY